MSQLRQWAAFEEAYHRWPLPAPTLTATGQDATMAATIHEATIATTGQEATIAATGQEASSAATGPGAIVATPGLDADLEAYETIWSGL